MQNPTLDLHLTVHVRAVITYGSSFGYVAAAWANRPPHYLQHTYQEYVYRDPTVRGLAGGRPFLC